MKNILTAVFLLAISNAYTQDLPSHAIQMVVGISRHTSGDVDGLTYGAEYVRYYSKKFSLAYNFRGTIHNEKHAYFVTYAPSGRTTDASIRFTTAGVQTGINAGLSIIRSRNHEFMISLGTFGRYQAASNGTDGYLVYYPNTIAGIPTYLFSYDNNTSQAAFSVGGLLQFNYNFRISKKAYVGLLPSLQTDTHGDLIIQLLLVGGRRL